MGHRLDFACRAAFAIALGLTAVGTAMPSAAQGVMDEWASVKAPPPPKLGHYTLDPKTTALLVLDLAHQTCDPVHRPRCIALLPRVEPLLVKARAKKWLVVYTLAASSTPADIMPQVARLGSEPIVKGFPDKFIGTDLEKILKDHGIKTVVAIGYASNGAVLETVASASFRGFDVVVPVDGNAAGNAYAEQYTIWDFANAPRLNEHVKLSALAWID